MSVFNLDNDSQAKMLASCLRKNDSAVIVACLCAFWCSSCREFMAHFEETSKKFPEIYFVWIDIENHTELLDDYDVVQFPTLQIENRHQVYFSGPILPNSNMIERMLSNLSELPAASPALKLWERITATF